MLILLIQLIRTKRNNSKNCQLTINFNRNQPNIIMIIFYKDKPVKNNHR
jgi:hypothetical protein